MREEKTERKERGETKREKERRDEGDENESGCDVISDLNREERKNREREEEEMKGEKEKEKEERRERGTEMKVERKDTQEHIVNFSTAPDLHERKVRTLIQRK